MKRHVWSLAFLLTIICTAIAIATPTTWSERTRFGAYYPAVHLGSYFGGPVKVDGYLDITDGALVIPAGTAPVNGVAATRTLTISGVCADTQTVTIGTRVYEFDTNSTITAGRVAADVSGGVTASACVTALVSAITGDASAVVTAVDGTGDTVDLTAKVKGAAANAYATTETMANGSFPGALMTGGVSSTVAQKGKTYFDGTYVYLSIDTSTVATTNWRRIAVGSAY